MSGNITIKPVWVPRVKNVIADSLSRCSDSDDWKIDRNVFGQFDKTWGPYTYDRFANNENSQCEKFNSRWWCPGTSGINAFMQPWNTECNWLVPPPRLISKTVDKLVFEKSSGTLVLPLWKSAPFWPKVYKHSNFLSFVKDCRVLDSLVIRRGRGNNGIFGKKGSIFKLIALKITF